MGLRDGEKKWVCSVKKVKKCTQREEQMCLRWLCLEMTTARRCHSRSIFPRDFRHFSFSYCTLTPTHTVFASNQKNSWIISRLANFLSFPSNNFIRNAFPTYLFSFLHLSQLYSNRFFFFFFLFHRNLFPFSENAPLADSSSTQSILYRNSNRQLSSLLWTLDAVSSPLKTHR